MLKKIAILILPLLGLIGGIAAGDLLTPKAEPEPGKATADGQPDAPSAAAGEGQDGEPGAADGAPAATGHGEAVAGAGSSESESADGGEHGWEGGGEHGGEGGGDGGGEDGGEGEKVAEWFSFPNQFFVPLVQNGEIQRMMVLTLTIETSAAELPKIEKKEHLLRDALLRSLIIHANTGGFVGNYTSEPKLEMLRAALYAAAVKTAGPDVHAVLIEDIGLSGG